MWNVGEERHQGGLSNQGESWNSCLESWAEAFPNEEACGPAGCWQPSYAHEVSQPEGGAGAELAGHKGRKKLSRGQCRATGSTPYAWSTPALLVYKSQWVSFVTLWLASKTCLLLSSRPWDVLICTVCLKKLHSSAELVSRPRGWLSQNVVLPDASPISLLSPNIVSSLE